MLAKGEKLQTNLLQASQRIRANSGVLNEVFGTQGRPSNLLGNRITPPQLSGGVENGANDLVVTGTPAKVAGEPVARLGFRRIRIAVQQGLGRDQHAWRTEAALERRMLEKFPLQWMRVFAPRQALDRLDRVTFGRDRKH